MAGDIGTKLKAKEVLFIRKDQLKLTIPDIINKVGIIVVVILKSIP